MAGGRWGAQRPLTAKGRNDARALGTSLAVRVGGALVLTSPERRARDTAALAFPSVVAGIRDQLSEVTKPWYSSGEEQANAAAAYLQGEVLAGWERREEVISRMAQLKSDFGSSQSIVLVSHGLLLTTWIDHERGLDDPFSFWSDLTMPDAWELNLADKSFDRVLRP